MAHLPVLIFFNLNKHTIKKVLTLDFIPVNTDFGLLLLRVWLGFGLFVKHGIEKFSNFSKWKDHFPDLIHVGSTPSLTFALTADGICSLLIIFGLGTRFAALFVSINLFIVFLIMHQFSFGQEHAELVYIYFGGFLALATAGGGKYSLERKLLY